MSSKRNHAIRSRKTYKSRMNAARMYLNGSAPKGAARSIQMHRTGGKPRRSFGLISAVSRLIRQRSREAKGAQEA